VAWSRVRELDDDDQPRPLRLSFAPAARELFERFEAEVNEERHQLGSDEVDGDSVYLGWLSKLAGQTARLAALLHVGAHWTGGGAGATLIDPETVNDAITLARYYREHALATFGLMGELPAQRLATTIARWLSTLDDAELQALTVRDVHRARSKATTADQIRSALTLLEVHGHVRLEKVPAGPTGGRPSERVHVNPMLRQ
jgi:Protein of unknown function (DUF3987)